jgi:tetratricopeptide (TPR) repeat protein
VIGAVLLAWALASRAEDSPVEEQAYEFNRAGMIAMSEARFEEAIEAFERAAKLAADYDISGKPLMYTPVFMTGWGSEKVGRTREACAAYRRYLRIAVEHPVEPTKVDHAKAYVSSNCQAPAP